MIPGLGILRSIWNTPNSYWSLSSIAGDENWSSDVKRYLEDVIGYLEKNYGDRIFAYSTFAGSGTEYYTDLVFAGYRKELGLLRYIDRNPGKERTYRKWLNVPNAKLPTLEAVDQTTHGMFKDLSQKSDKETYDYLQFQNKIVGDMAFFIAKTVKEITKNRKSTGLFYGYLTGISGRHLYSGHLGFEKVWNSPYNDMIYSPTDYQVRKLTDTSGYLVPADSLPLRNKLFFLEIDYFITTEEGSVLENGFKVALNFPKGTLKSVIQSCLRREFINSLDKRTGLWWFDFFGHNYVDPVLMNEV